MTGENAKKLCILGTRGIPARHGGFETFAEHLSIYLVKRGWTICVYCQGENGGPSLRNQRTVWNGVNLITIYPFTTGALSTIEFDIRSMLHCLESKQKLLVLGYNTAFLLILAKIFRRFVAINMDGIEWKRPKWSKPAKAWLYMNERLGVHLGDRVVADHPAISKYLQSICRRSIDMIPYGAEEVVAADETILGRIGGEPHNYFLCIGRIEPENSILEIVKAYCLTARKEKLIILGDLSKASAAYRESVIRAANGRVLFPGAIYDKEVVRTLRKLALCYVHGHQVGGTNPSLVESLAAARPVLAHRNKFNVWTAGSRQFYFDSVESCAAAMTDISRNGEATSVAAAAALEQFRQHFTWEIVLRAYEDILYDAPL
ncbi:DUF1972 domain-containing protein [Methylorubrum extorquens]|uniref:DUF1972 domain-containing protein n=1 Tax=Methylorubrum extorquens TaxID=408 RepID=UPI001649BC0E|nr:DUF1972 domain-containing protein [Methylorubrum extorquens]